MNPLQHEWIFDKGSYNLKVGSLVYGVVYEIPCYVAWRWDTGLTAQYGSKETNLITYETRELAQEALLKHVIEDLEKQITQKQSVLQALKGSEKRVY